MICFLLDEFLRCAPKSLVMAHICFPSMLYLLGEFCHLLVIFDNCLNPDQAPLLVIPYLDLFDTLIVYLKELKKLKKKISRWQKSMRNYPACKELTLYLKETPFNAFANRTDLDQAAHLRAA